MSCHFQYEKTGVRIQSSTILRNNDFLLAVEKTKNKELRSMVAMWKTKFVEHMYVHRFTFWQKWKMSIQYMVLGFEPTTFGTQVSSHNHKARASALMQVITFVKISKETQAKRNKRFYSTRI